MKRFFCSVFLFAAVLVHAEPARACSPACSVPKLAPAAGASIPASAPGFLFVGYGADTGKVQLLDANDAVVAGAFEKDPLSDRTFFKPTNALAPGGYKTRSPASCGSDTTVDALFTLTATAPLPTTSGHLTVKKVGRETLSASTSSGSCTEPVDAGYVDLDLSIDPSVAPYAAIVAWETKVDGNWWAGRDPITVASAPFGNARSYLRIFTSCDGKVSQGRDNGLSGGVHDVAVRAVLPGGATLVAATLSVDVSCKGNAITGDGEIAGSGSGGGEGGGSYGEGGGRSSTSPSSTDATGFRGSQDGCSATPQSVSSTSIATAVMALLAIAGMRRRRSSN